MFSQISHPEPNKVPANCTYVFGQLPTSLRACATSKMANANAESFPASHLSFPQQSNPDNSNYMMRQPFAEEAQLAPCATIQTALELSPDKSKAGPVWNKQHVWLVYTASPSKRVRSSVQPTLHLYTSRLSAEHRVAGPPHLPFIFSPMNHSKFRKRSTRTQTPPRH